MIHFVLDYIVVVVDLCVGDTTVPVDLPVSTDTLYLGTGSVSLL